MGLMQKLFGGAEAQPLPSARSRAGAPPGGSEGRAVSPISMRRELLRLALRQSLLKNGIPSSWIVAEALEVSSRGGGTPGVHIRLVMQHWEPRLLPYTLSFQQDLEQRLLAVEPEARSWLRGFSWQYAKAEGEPGPMPDPATWADGTPQPESAPVAMEPPQPGPPRKTKEELARLFAQQDRIRARDEAPPDFAPTQPASW